MNENKIRIFNEYTIKIDKLLKLDDQKHNTVYGLIALISLLILCVVLPFFLK